MKIHFTIVVILCCFISAGNASVLSVKDSIGIEKINGNVFILHKVEAKETLYSLSKRYNASIEEIVKHNPASESGLKLGEVLKIPYQQEQKSTSAQKSHTVAPGQTLFSIAQLNNVSVDDIKKWNNLSSNDLNVGQTLVISPSNGRNNQKDNGKQNKANKEEKRNNKAENENDPSSKVVHNVEPSQTLFSISQIYNVEVEDIKKWNNLDGNALDVGQKLTIKVNRKANKYDETEQIPVITEEVAQENVVRIDNKVEPEVKKPLTEEGKSEKKSEAKNEPENKNSSGFKKIVELGLAEIIEDASDTKKYVALHRTAPIGTIMQVTNEMNNQNVFVRVIGKLPETGVNDKVLIKLSRPAFERLGAVNDKFPAEISYVP